MKWESYPVVAGAVGKVEIPPLSRDFQAEEESPALGLFHGAAFSTALLPTNSAKEPEVINGKGHVVLQVQVLEDAIQLQGEWHDDHGNGLKLVDETTQHRGAALFEANYRRDEKEWDKVFIESMFVYPSSRCLAIWSIDNIVPDCSAVK